MGDKNDDDYYSAEGEEDTAASTTSAMSSSSNTTSSSNSSFSPLLKSWRILCEDGDWTDRPLECDDSGRPVPEVSDSSGSGDGGGVERAGGGGEGSESHFPFNSSCPFPKEKSALESNIVAFHGDRRLNQAAEGQTEHFEPGTELVYRCVDIGKGRGERKGGRERMQKMARKESLVLAFFC